MHTMKPIRSIIWASVLSLGTFAQTPRTIPSQDQNTKATEAEMAYFRFMLLNLGHLDTPQSITRYEELLGRQFGLTQAELGVIDSAGAQLRPLLGQISRTLRMNEPDRMLSAEESRAASALISQRDLLIPALVQQVLRAIRPESAVRLRMPGHIIASAVNTSANNTKGETK